MLLAAKCFASARTCCCTPRMNATPMRPRCTVSSPYVSWARPQRGWRRMLMVGASSTLPAFARTSAPIASPTCSSRSGSHVAPRAEPTGNAVAWPAYWPTPRGPSTIANPGMPSRSSGAVRHVPSISVVPCICWSFSSIVIWPRSWSMRCSTTAPVSPQMPTSGYSDVTTASALDAAAPRRQRARSSPRAASHGAPIGRPVSPAAPHATVIARAAFACKAASRCMTPGASPQAPPTGSW